MRNRKDMNRISCHNRGYAFKGLLAVNYLTNPHLSHYSNTVAVPIRICLLNQFNRSIFPEITSAEPYEPHREKRPDFCLSGNKSAEPIEQFLFLLSPKFQASGHLLWLYRPVCVRPVRKTITRFPRGATCIKAS